MIRAVPAAIRQSAPCRREDVAATKGIPSTKRATPRKSLLRGAVSPFQEALRKTLHTAATADASGGGPAVLASPLYGQWYVNQPRVPADDAPPHWFRELNLDPRHRVAPGLGTQVIRFEQEQLMASAWDQVGEAGQPKSGPRPLVSSEPRL
jgi:hypothetical protein